MGAGRPQYGMTLLALLLRVLPTPRPAARPSTLHCLRPHPRRLRADKENYPVLAGEDDETSNGRSI